MALRCVFLLYFKITQKIFICFLTYTILILKHAYTLCLKKVGRNICHHNSNRYCSKFIRTDKHMRVATHANKSDRQWSTTLCYVCAASTSAYIPSSYYFTCYGLVSWRSNLVWLMLLLARWLSLLRIPVQAGSSRFVWLTVVCRQTVSA